MKKLSPMITFLSFFLCPFVCILLLMDMSRAQNVTTAVNVGVVLDLNTTNVDMILRCMNMSLTKFYAINGDYKTRLLLDIEDSKGDCVGAAAAALNLIKNKEVKAIFGPGYSTQAPFVIQLGNKSHVPIISFTATSPSLTSIRSPYFIRATQNDSSQVKAIGAIVKAFSWREVVPIYVDNEFGEGIIPYLADELEDINTRISYRSVISPFATGEDIAQELYKLMTMQTRVFIVHMLPVDGARLFAKAKEIGMMSEGYAWILTNGMTDLMTLLNETNLMSMQGVLGLKTYVPKSQELEHFTAQWKRKTHNAKLNIFGLWAYDATTALAMAVEKAKFFNFGFGKTYVSRNATDLEAFRVSKVGPRLLHALSQTRFKGLAGEFHLIDGQLHTSTFQIVNVNGNGDRLIGFWTKREGLVKSYSPTENGTYSTRRDHLRPIIWPGETTSVPKGWEIPTNGKKLRIGVPKKTGFREFVTVTKNLRTNKTEATGFCIDVFIAVIQAMPYAVTYEYASFENTDGKPAGSYNDLVYQVYLGNYDAVVGDTTIVANRSSYVDFTLPYTEAGAAMVVPLQDKREKHTLDFAKPLTWKLWVITGCSFIFIGLVVWVLEYRINENFRGNRGTMFWFSFSTMFFAHREPLKSNWTRFVVIVWCFVVLLITQSYTASLASLLTVQQFQPRVTNINDLLKNGDNVGCKRSSFLFAKLQKLGFHDSKLKNFGSADELHELFSRGASEGRIVAAFDEVPYIKLFLAQYCSKYGMVELPFKSDGFGFAFPMGSPLVPDVSRAILTVTEGEKMKKIENAWINKQSSCPDLDVSPSFSKLDVTSFWLLFVIVLGVSVFALVGSLAKFALDNPQHFRGVNTVPQRIVVLFQKYGEAVDNHPRVQQCPCLLPPPGSPPGTPPGSPPGTPPGSPHGPPPGAPPGAPPGPPPRAPPGSPNGLPPGRSDRPPQGPPHGPPHGPLNGPLHGPVGLVRVPNDNRVAVVSVTKQCKCMEIESSIVSQHKTSSNGALRKQRSLKFRPIRLKVA